MEKPIYNIEPTKLKRIAIVRLSAIGDVTMMVPVVRRLQRAFPHATIYWIIGKVAHSLVCGLSDVEFIVLDKPNSLKGYLNCYQQLKPYHFDVLLAAQASFRTNILYPLIKAPIKIGFDKARACDGHRFVVNQRIPATNEHLLDGFMRFAESLIGNMGEEALTWELPIDEVHHQWAREQLSANSQIVSGAWLAINPSASKAERNWSIDRYIAVINQAAERWPLNIVIIGGPSQQEKKLSDQIVARANIPCLNLTSKTNLKQLAAVLAKVDVLLSPDSGPLHIAVAVNTPVVGLYAVAPPELSGPYLYQDLVVNKYPEAVKTILKQDPKTIPFGKRVHNQKAMQLIQVDDVLEKLERCCSHSH